MKIKSYVIYFIIIGFVLTGSVSTLEATGPSEQVVEERIIVRGWEIITIHESSDSVYIECEPILDSVEQLEAYKNNRISLLHNISNVMNPEEEIGAKVILNEPLSFNESVKLATEYNFTLKYLEYIGSGGIQGGTPILPGEPFEERIEQLKRGWGNGYKIIGLTMLQGHMPVRRLLAFQNAPSVFLIDIGPPERYEDWTNGKDMFVSYRNIYYALTKSLPPSTAIPPATTLYLTTYTLSATTDTSSTTTMSATTSSSSPNTTPATTDSFINTTTTAPLNTTTPNSSMQVEEFRFNGFFIVLELIALFAGVQLLRLSRQRTQRRFCK